MNPLQLTKSNLEITIFTFLLLTINKCFLNHAFQAVSSIIVLKISHTITLRDLGISENPIEALSIDSKFVNQFLPIMNELHGLDMITENLTLQSTSTPFDLILE